MNKVLIIGGGFAGISALGRLAKYRKEFEITLLDKKETSDFLPMLPDILSERIHPKFLTSPLDKICKKLKCAFINEEVVSLDLEKKTINTQSRTLEYDYLLIASGSETNFYGNNEVKKYAFKLDRASGAEKILEGLRSGAFDNFVIAGGGYTGVEAATNLKYYCLNHKKKNRIVIVEKSPRLLGPLPDWMKSYVSGNLKDSNIEVFTNTGVDKVDGESVSLSNKETLRRAMLIWTAGVKAGDCLLDLKVDRNPQGRIKTDENLKIGRNCFAAGDAAQVVYSGQPLRMSVQFAITQGRRAAENIIRDRRDAPLLKYKPLDLGYVIPMANGISCGNILKLNLKGVLPTALHYLMCIYRSLGVSNKGGIIRDLLIKGGGMNIFISSAHWLLRLALASVFLYHGIGKFPNLNHFAAMLKIPYALALLVAFMETIGAVLLLLGGFTNGKVTRLGALMFVPIMLVAIFKVHWGQWSFLPSATHHSGGIEFQVTLLALSLYFLIKGNKA